MTTERTASATWLARCAIPTTYSKTPGEIRRLPPRLGEHSIEVPREAGFSQGEIDAMLASGATRAC